MKKIIKTTLIIFIFVLLFGGINVSAATSLPASYSENGYDYTIDNFKIACYKGTSIPLKEENKVQEEYSIHIPTTDLTIAPELKELTSKPVSGNPLPVVSINLNLKMNKSFTEYSRNFMSGHGEVKQYMCILKAEYKIKKKEEYNYFYNFDNVLMEHENIDNALEDGYYKGTQIIDFMKRDNDNFYTSIGNGDVSGSEIALANYGILSTADIDELSEQNNDKVALVYVHNLNNFEQLLKEKRHYDILPNEDDNQNNTTDNLEETPVHKVTKQIQTVKVPNTAASSSIYIMFISSIMLLLGGSILLYTLIKPKVLVRINKK